MFQGGVQLKPEQFIVQTPEVHKSLQTILEIQEAHRDEYNAIMKRHDPDYLDGARAGIIVCSMAFNYHCAQRKDIDPRVGAGIISMGIMEGPKLFRCRSSRKAPPLPARQVIMDKCG